MAHPKDALSQLDTHGHGIDGEPLEEALHALYQSRLVHKSPFIHEVL